MQIKGREVYKFAVTKFEELIEDAMRKCELSQDQVKLATADGATAATGQARSPPWSWGSPPARRFK